MSRIGKQPVLIPDKVKVTVRFRGRELAHQDLGYALLNRVKSETAPIAKVAQVQGPLYAVPAPQFTVDNSAPPPAPMPPAASAPPKPSSTAA